VKLPPNAGRAAIFAALLLLAAPLAWRMELSVDLGFHIAAGRWILEHRAWPRVDAFTWTQADRPYIDMNGLFQIALSLAHRAGGMFGVGLLRLAFVLATLAVLWLSARARKVESPALLGLGFLLALFTMEGRFQARPELVSGLFLAIQLHLLHERRPLAAVPLQLVWVYAHSASVLGIAVLALYAATHWRAREAWLALAGAAVAMLLNPYGVHGVLWQWNLHERFSGGDLLGDTIGELSSPFSAGASRFTALIFFKLLLTATGVALIANLRRISLFDLAVVVLFGALAATAMRMVNLFAIAALPVALEAAQPKVGRLLEKRGALAAALIAIAFAGEQTLSGGFYEFAGYALRFGFEEPPAMFPEGTVKTLAGLEGPLFNPIAFGGYLELHHPEQKPFVDARLEVMDESFYVAYLHALYGDGWDALESRWHPAVALVPANARKLVRHLLEAKEWALVDVDAVSFLFARVTREQVEAIEAGQERLRTLDARGGRADDAIAPSPRPPWLTRLLGPRRVPFEAFGRGANFLQAGLFEAARRDLRQALLDSSDPAPALIKNYAIALAQLGRLEEARVWCKALLERSPEDRDAGELLVALRSNGS
jgi:tetratricopeptide (TPR) repeat protein